MAHPRSRGENPTPARRPFAKSGSSPLTRGKHLDLTEVFTGGRLIPAHAGKTTRQPRSTQLHQAHPRSRGENFSLMKTLERARGSSPLTRGKRWPVACRTAPPRLIPAHAGKTRSSPWSPSPLTAHPRSRGENTYAGEDRNLALGSSPLTRGKLSTTTRGQLTTGLIPAHAGKTARLRVPLAARAAHPRSRGENNLADTVGQASAGSSPLTRGKPSMTATRRSPVRLIPAHAGKTGHD